MARFSAHVVTLGLLVLSALLLAPACSDDGVTTSCDNMPVSEQGSDDPEVRAWWTKAAQEGCATPPGGNGEGGAGD
jgi:hypothetical protein